MIPRLLVLLIAATIAANTLQGQVQAPFADGEELLYNVSYRAALIPPINMMRVSIMTFEEDFGSARQFHILGNGRTTGAAKGVFELNDTYHSWLDVKTLLPRNMTSYIRENNYRFHATYSYDWNAMTVSNVRRNARWTEDRQATFTLPDMKSGDALSLLYRMRAIDPAALSPGWSTRLYLVLDEDAKPIVLRFIGREEIKIRKIGRFHALKFTCTMATSDGSVYEEGMTLTAWISDDANKIPLLLESPVRIGRVSVTLAEGFHTIHPLDSFIE